MRELDIQESSRGKELGMDEGVGREKPCHRFLVL